MYPPVGSSDLSSQFDTTHVDGSGRPDKGQSDWIGYVFGETRTFVGLLFQAGVNQAPSGGWFDSLTVEVRDPLSQRWNPAQGLVATPVYSVGEGTPASYATYQLHFDPAAGDGIRLAGVPGGTGQFVSVGELRVLASPTAPPGPAGFTATLTVTDADGGQDSESAIVAADGSPPSVSILSPVNGGTYPTGVVTAVPLTAVVSDAESAPEDLVCDWQIEVIHEQHGHPDPPLSGCSGQATLVPHGELLGDQVYWRFELTVTDPQGLSTTVVHYLVPDADQNVNGFDDAEDLANGVSLDKNGNGVPDECERDCDGDGLSDGFVLNALLDTDLNQSGRPDGCEPVLTGPFPGVVDQVNDFDVTMATPNSLQAFLVGTQAGPFPLFGCFKEKVIAMGILDWFFIKALFSNEAGESTLKVGLPSSLTGVTILVQMVAPLDCEVSSIATFTFP